MSRNNNTPHDLVPIPTYEEAISSRAHSSQSYHGPGEVSDDAERQGLLRLDGSTQEVTSRSPGYAPPTVESARSSYDSEITSPELTSDDEDGELRRDMEHMEVLEPDSRAERRAQRRAYLRNRFRKRFARFTETLSSLHLPSIPSRFIPSFSFITDHLPRLSDEYRPGWPIIARLFGLFILVTTVYALVILRAFPIADIGNLAFTPEAVRRFIQETPDGKTIQHFLHEVTKDDHMAGTKGDFYLAEWVKGRFISSNLKDIEEDMYHVYLNYPRANGRRVAIIEPPELAWEAKLEEEHVFPESGQHQTMVFHGHSRSGNVTGPLVYANYGSKEDFQKLKDQGVHLAGSIALVRYYGPQSDRAMKVKLAELAGAAGCLIYSDPADDGFVRGEPWPEGQWRPSDSVQRGAVSLMGWVVGDVLTPGWPSAPNEKRISKDNNPGLVNIPSLPIAWRDAKVLLQSLKGHGQEVPNEWKGGVPDVEWWTGDSNSPTIHLKNLQDENDLQPIVNIIGRLPGAETPESTVYVGNHRDAWCYGASDPGTGTAVFLEVVRVFGELAALGWRPRRTIVFASWDAEEYNLIGSTEHVEDRIKNMRENGVAYLNVDVGVVGQEFWAAASPVFSRPLQRVLNRVTDPATNLSLRHLWDESGSSIEGLGAGSDYVAFQSLAGTSSIDFGFRGEAHSYPYHSCYDSFEYVRSKIDPDFAYHTTLAQVWGLLILELADEPILPFDFPNYAAEMERYVALLHERIAAAEAATSFTRDAAASSRLNLTNLISAAKLLHANAQDFDKWPSRWAATLAASRGAEDRNLAIARLSHNARMTWFETHLLDLPPPGLGRTGGLPGREQFKHVVFAPSLQDGYREAYFPGIRDALEEGDWGRAQEQVEVVAAVLKHAAEELVF